MSAIDLSSDLGLVACFLLTFKGSTCLRVDWGSSWLHPAWLLRSATRDRNPADYRYRAMGFRVARTLP